MQALIKKMDWNLTTVSASIAAALLAAACGGGGGGGVAGVGSGGTGFVTGFGSVIIDGVKYDDSAFDTVGTLKVEDGANDVNATRNRLRLGQRVEIEFENEAIRTAVIQSELEGLISGSPTNSTLVVAGQTVRINTDAAAGPLTVFEGATQGTDFVAGDRVEVHGELVPDGSAFLASRIERKPAVDGNNNPIVKVKLSGVVANLTPTSFTIGTITVNRDANTAITPAAAAAQLANGQRVKVFSNSAIAGSAVTANAIRIREFRKSLSDFRLRGVVSRVDSQTSFVINGITVDASGVANRPTIVEGQAYRVRGTYTAGSTSTTAGTLRAIEVKVNNDDAVNRAELTGSITDFVDASNFRVRGVLVDASNVSNLPALSNGLFVEVKGGVVNGKVQAASLEVKNAVNGSELKITDTVTSLDTNARTFRLGTRTVNYANSTFDDGTVNNLVDGALVEVEGRLNSSGVLVAREIEFKSPGSTGTSSSDREVKDRLAADATASGEDVVFSLQGVSLRCTAGLFDGLCAVDRLRRGVELEARYTATGAAPFAVTRLKRED